jgi:hypothetical protein
MVAKVSHPSSPRISIARTTALVVAVLLGLFLVGFLPLGATSLAYLVLVLATIAVVRSGPVEPGAWLGLRLVRRALVLLISVITIDFLTSGSSYQATEFPLLLALALADFALGRATRRIASAEARDLDERQESLRNRAHRIAYSILAGSVVLVLVIADLATPESHRWLADAIRGGAAISFLQLVLFLPAMVIAWIEPDRISDEDAPRLRRSLRAQLAYAMVALCIVVPVLLSVALLVAPVRTSAFTVANPVEFGAGSACGNDHGLYFEARKQAGWGFAATIPITAVACWNGTRAYPLWGVYGSDCHPRGSEGIIDSTVACQQRTSSDGTLTFTYQTTLRPAILPFISRDVVMTLSLTKDGKVVRFP